MPTRLRKTRRLRGSRTVGWGQIGQHRKKGGKGGSGKAGLHKHKWSWTVKYAPDHFAKDSFRPPVQVKARRWINVGELEKLTEKINLIKEGEKPILNLAEMGYDKLLGEGRMGTAFKIIVKSYTETAKAKVEKVGGEIVAG